MGSRTVRIRDAVSGDAAAIAAIGAVEFARTHAHLLGAPATRAVVEQTYNREAVAESIARCASADDAHFLVAERDGRVVGYAHYDAFASEPELHRIYLKQDEIGRGTGSRLMNELHARLGRDATYIVITAVANEATRRFYERHGLVEERRIPDGNAFYRDSMGVQFPPDASPVPAVILRRR
jgi:L-amino acid N-acyltransferase YncA